MRPSDRLAPSGPRARSSAAAAELWRRFRPLVLFIGAIWALHLVNIAMGGALTRSFGLVPRTLSGLDGVLGMPFLHGSWAHLAGNTPPLIVLGGLILLLTPERFNRATVFAVVLGGALTWIFARQNNHIGASGLIFAWFGFLVALGVFERSWRALLGAAAALALYGARTIVGLDPTSESVSWDGHLAGLAAGIAAGWALRRPRRAAVPPPPG